MIIIMLLAKLVSSTCPSFECGVFTNTSYCGIVSVADETVYLNYETCELGGLERCSYLDLLDLYDLAEAVSYSDSENPTGNSTDDDPNIVEDFEVVCSTQSSTYNFMNIARISQDLCQNKENLKTEKLAQGQHPKECETNLDCKLVNGNYANCSCSTFQRKYCEPGFGDSIVTTALDMACDGDYAKLRF